MKLSKRTQAHLFLLLNTVLWGASFIIIKPSLEYTTAYRFLLYRYALAGFFSLPFLVYYWPKVKKKSQHVFRITGIELIGTTFALALLYAGLDRTSAIEASLLNNTLPIFVALGGWWLLREKIQRHELVGLSIAFMGALLLTFFPLFGGVPLTNSISLWG
ncbi:MAG TPA: DMT family transporter, partial [Patescibacteria group bacterium]